MLGRFLFRWRSFIGLVAFVVVFWLARPTITSCLLGIPLLLVGLAVRFWASGYIGVKGRVREIGASRRLGSGPYRLLRHPLYIGNFLLVAGMLLALRPALWLVAVVLAGFVVEYAFIVAAEEVTLRGVGNRESKVDGRELLRTRRNAEARTADGEPTDMAEGKGQEPEAKTTAGESFTVGRAMCEWRTWVVTGAAFGLVLLKAVLRAS